MKKLLLIILFAQASAIPAKAAQWFPFKKEFAPLAADSTNPSFGVRATSVVGAKGFADINMGDELGIVRFDMAKDMNVQIGAMGGVAARFNISKKTYDLQIADYTFAIPVDIKFNEKFILRVMYWHTSSHIGDDYIKYSGLNPALMTSNTTDDARVMGSYNIFNWLRFYGGAGYAFKQLPDRSEPWRAQMGAEATHTLSATSLLFLAADAAWKENLAWQPSFTARGGIEFSSEKAGVQFYAEFFSGHLPYLGFMDQSETHWSFGFTAKM